MKEANNYICLEPSASPHAQRILSFCVPFPFVKLLKFPLSSFFREIDPFFSLIGYKPSNSNLLEGGAFTLLSLLSPEPPQKNPQNSEEVIILVTSAKWRDDAFPTGWQIKISLKQQEISDFSMCVFISISLVATYKEEYVKSFP